jgi:ubiquinone/menaquinone biosynthesis C-methylase UbiE
MNRAPDPQRARDRYERLAATYDRQYRLVGRIQDSLRRDAVARLRLQPGDTVLDIGCGTGASFALLEQAVGTRGRLIGVEQSRAMLDRARHRAEQAGWSNVTCIEAPAHEAVIPPVADAALFFFTHDILRSREALANVLGAVRPGGRVVAAGGRQGCSWLLPVNIVWWLVARRYATTLEGAREPWGLLMPHLVSPKVESRGLGLLYIAAGATPP